MPAVYVSRISQWIEKRYNAKGGNVINDVDPSAVVVAPLLIGVEERYGQGWNTYIESVIVNAVAAQFSRFQLGNPKGSNVIAVVESIYMLNTAQDWTIANAQAPLLNPLPAELNRLDSRSLFGGPTMTRSVDNNATQVPGAANVIMRHGVVGEVILHIDQEIPVLPNDELMIFTDAVNTQLAFNMRWRERALEQSELT